MDSSFQHAAPAALDKRPAKPGGSESVALTAGGIAALLAGAWLANLQLLEPYRPVFIGIALRSRRCGLKRPAADSCGRP